MWVDRVIGDFRTVQQGQQMSAMFGGKPEWTTLAERLDEFETALAAEPPRLDPEEEELREALGLRSGRG